MKSSCGCATPRKDAANRYKMTAHPFNIGEGRRNKIGWSTGAAHGGNAARFIDRRADHSEIEPLGASDISIEHLAHMQTDIHIGDQQQLACTPHAECLYLFLCFDRSSKRGRTGVRAIFSRKDRKNAVADQLQHVPTLRVDRRNNDVGIIVQQRDDLLRRANR